MGQSNSPTGTGMTDGEESCSAVSTEPGASGAEGKGGTLGGRVG